MKSNFPIQVIGLGHIRDQITRRKIQFFEEYRKDPANARLFIILITHKQVEMISDGTKYKNYF